MLVLITTGWLESPNCIGELKDIKTIMKMKANNDQTELLLIILDDKVKSHPKWNEVASIAKNEFGAEAMDYTQTAAPATKESTEQVIWSKIDNGCQIKRLQEPAKMIAAVKDWDDAKMG